MTITEKIPASEVREGDFLPGIDNGYVFEVEENNGYLSYPSTRGGCSVAMSDDTILIGFHDADGNECYLLMPSDSEIGVSR